MKIAALAAPPPETRAVLVPADAGRLAALGAEVAVAAGIGRGARIDDESYRRAGAAVVADPAALAASADLLLAIRKPAAELLRACRPGAIVAALFDPVNDPEPVDLCVASGVTALSLEMIPRITRAQKMDVLSSQASLAGYVAVILAAERLPKIFPMMMTAAGTIAPARVFVVGAGVAGLQAIATAKRLGARVEAFDTRPVVAEQVRSLGARFVAIDLGATGQTKDGYARELTADQLARQREELARVCAASDVVITTAQVFGRPAPRIVTAAMLRGMAPGSVVVDLAVESGGNVEGSRPGEEVEIAGVRLIGLANLPGRVAVHASQVFSANMLNLIGEYWDPARKSLRLDLEDEILKGCIVTHGGRIVNPLVAASRADRTHPGGPAPGQGGG